jgi:hypothetical protein
MSDVIQFDSEPFCPHSDDDLDSTQEGTPLTTAEALWDPFAFLDAEPESPPAPVARAFDPQATLPLPADETEQDPFDLLPDELDPFEASGAWDPFAAARDQLASSEGSVAEPAEELSPEEALRMISGLRRSA